MSWRYTQSVILAIGSFSSIPKTLGPSTLNIFHELSETYTGLHWSAAMDSIAYFAVLEDIAITRVVSGTTVYYSVMFDKKRIVDRTVDEGPSPWQELLAAVVG